MVLESTNQFSSMGKNIQDLFSGIIQIVFRSKEKANRTEKTDRLLTITELGINNKVFKTSSMKGTN